MMKGLMQRVERRPVIHVPWVDIGYHTDLVEASRTCSRIPWPDHHPLAFAEGIGAPRIDDAAAITVGSRSAALSRSAMSEVVVVCRCAWIDTVAQGRISSASISARRMMEGRALRRFEPGLPAFTALEMTRWPAP